ncbi:unnamed protein product [Adineta steineri]|uniref:Fatty acid synthase n=1 Tax=Adineta steineri TaxID=433720 RepID=A0A814UEN3_9BILA|nr:unnamed protein product [Adineta steineri]CAF1173875.1 unnamed protein product [Adineta steineri]
MQNDLLANLPAKSIPEFLEYQAQNRPNKTYLLYPDLTSDPLRYASATFAQVNDIANHLANKYAKHIDISSNSQKPIVVGLLANTSVNYLLTFYGLVKLGVVVFTLSIRNSKAALEHLIKTTGVSYLVIEPGQIQIELDGLKLIPLENIDWNKNYNSSQPINRTEKGSLEDSQLILHSSGSTAFPKPIHFTNRGLFYVHEVQSNANNGYRNENDVVLTFGALFHILGLGTAIGCLISGSTYALPLSKIYPPTPKQLVANIQAEQINKIVSVPILLEQLINELESDKSATYAPLKRLKHIFYGGASLPEHIARKFVDNGVRLTSSYGTTETGMVMLNDLNAPIARYNFMKIAEWRKPFVIIRPDDHVLVHLPNDPFCQPGIANQPDGSYDTNDVFIEDPPGSGEYRVEGRQDDTLIHVNGEKTNAIPMEHNICAFPIVKHAAVFGHKRLCTGVLIELNREEADNYSNDEIPDLVWEAVQAANKTAPNHSRIVRQMIKCLPMSKTLSVTDKGNIMRKRIYNDYADVIDKLYEKFLKPDQQNTELSKGNKQEWDQTSLKNYILELLTKLNIKDSDQDFDTSKSIFDVGFDSLHAVQLRNELTSIFPSIPLNFIYEFSTIDSMVDELISRNNKINTKSINNDPKHYVLTENLIDKYINLMKNDSSPINPIKKNNKERIFLITGANGSLGSWIVLDLLKHDSVSKVYCFFRGQDKSRIIKEYEQRYQTTDIFNENNKRVVLLGNMSLSEGFLGQNYDLYNQLCNEVTDIVHSAYRMDFNMTVRDFEKDGILGTYNLLKLARKANARFHFISSVASSGSGIVPVVKEEPLIRRPELPIAQGYGQSKYVCEHLGAAAKQLWNVPVDIYRIGQVSGDSINGAWNTSEMVSLIICIGGGQLGQMPSQGQDVRWIPVDIAALSVVDIALQDYIKSDDVHHVLNPHSITWSTFLDYLKKAGLHFRIVNPAEWLDMVLKSETALVKLSSFFDTFFTSKTGFQISEYETVKTEARSKYLHSCPSINVDLIHKYLKFWHDTGFLTNGYP